MDMNEMMKKTGAVLKMVKVAVQLAGVGAVLAGKSMINSAERKFKGRRKIFNRKCQI